MANKKTNKKWFRIAVEGDTTDGREIVRQDIVDIDETYNPEKYGARLNCEHIRGYVPEGPFGAYGDITAVKTDDYELDGETKLALYGEVDPTDTLLALNKKRQKVYTSIEIRPNFANSGKTYLMGMAITDSPASLGTEMMKFSAGQGDNSPLLARKEHPDNLFTASIEQDFDFPEIEPKGEQQESFSSKIKAMFTKNKKQTSEDFAEVQQAIEAVAGEITELSEKIPEDQSEKITELTEQLSTMKTEFNEFKAEVDGIELHGTRPAATGGNGSIQTDC